MHGSLVPDSVAEQLAWLFRPNASVLPPGEKCRAGQGYGRFRGGYEFGPTQPGGTRMLVVLTAFGLGLVLSGCAGYKLGPTNGVAAREKSVQINPFPNLTLQPRLTDFVTAQVRKELQRDGTYQLASNDPDIILSGSLTRYLRQEVTLAPSDVLTVRDYRLVLTAKVNARERSTGKVLFDQDVTGYTLMRVGADLPSAERQAMPLLAADLAKNVIALLVDGKWWN